MKLSCILQSHDYNVIYVRENGACEMVKMKLKCANNKIQQSGEVSVLKENHDWFHEAFCISMKITWSPGLGDEHSDFHGTVASKINLPGSFFQCDEHFMFSWET